MGMMYEYPEIQKMEGIGMLDKWETLKAYIMGMNNAAKIVDEEQITQVMVDVMTTMNELESKEKAAYDKLMNKV